ncbi:MAG: hypothetical protein EHM80_16500, partial [Nitrospiraceae bacterium]
MRFLRGTTAGIILLLIVPTISMAEERSQPPPELRLSLHDAIQAAVDNNVNVRLLRERIAAAQSAANTS